MSSYFAARPSCRRPKQQFSTHTRRCHLAPRVLCSLEKIQRSIMGVPRKGQRNWERKKELIPRFRAGAKQCRKLVGHHVLLSCTGGFILDVLWKKENFEHLCGVWCDRPPAIVHAGKVTESGFFYDQLLKGRLPSAAIHYSDWNKVRGKASVIAAALGFIVSANTLSRVDTGELIVDSKRMGIMYFCGNECWSLGFGEYSCTSQYCRGKVCYPQSLRKQAILKQKREHTAAHVIERVQII